MLDLKSQASSATRLDRPVTESNRPPFEELSLEEFKAPFPEARYTFSGETVEGRQRLRGAATLSRMGW